MNREYHRWYSYRLHRVMEVLVLGHAGPRVLVFPTRAGRFFDYDSWGLAGVLADRLEAGAIQLFCVDSIDWESLYAVDRPWEERIWKHVAYESYVLDEVVPLSQLKNPHPDLIAHGCSLGAYHAVNIAAKHPARFRKVVALSGRYDLTIPLGDYPALFPGVPGDTVYFNMPSLFLPNLRDPAFLEPLRRLEVVLAVGQEDVFRRNNEELAFTLGQLGVPHQLHLWEGEAHRARYWRKMVPLYL